MDNKNLKKSVFSPSENADPQRAHMKDANDVPFPPSSVNTGDSTPYPQQEKKSTGTLTYVLIAVSALCLVAIAILCMYISRLSNDEQVSVTTAPTEEIRLEATTEAPVDTTTEEITESTTLYPPDYPAYLIELNEKYDHYFDFLPDENGFVIPDSDTRLISVWELYTMTEHQVCLARNELYARHGYIFKSEKYSDYYSQFSWYVPTTTVLPELVGTELENVKTIVAYEDAQGWS